MNRTVTLLLRFLKSPKHFANYNFRRSQRRWRLVKYHLTERDFEARSGSRKCRKWAVVLKRPLATRFINQIVRLFDDGDDVVVLFLGPRALANLVLLDDVIRGAQVRVWRCHDLLERKIISDSGEFQARHHDAIRLEYNLSRRWGDLKNPIFLPQPIHDGVAGQLKEVLVDPVVRRPVTIFFSGNFVGYNKGPVSKLGILERAPIVSAYRKLDNVVHVESAADLEKQFATMERKGVFVDTTKTRVERRRWIRTLAQVDFFLCPPGAFNPICHNLVEAMSVGAIPITNWENWIHPSLQHGIDCLAFRDVDQLEEVCRIAGAMKQAEVVRMRKNVLDFFDTHLSDTAIRRKFSQRSDIGTIVMNSSRFDYFDDISSESVCFGRSVDWYSSC